MNQIWPIPKRRLKPSCCLKCSFFQRCWIKQMLSNQRIENIFSLLALHLFLTTSPFSHFPALSFSFFLFPPDHLLLNKGKWSEPEIEPNVFHIEQCLSPIFIESTSMKPTGYSFHCTTSEILLCSFNFSIFNKLAMLTC